MDSKRDQILETARRFPGLHMRELARQAGTSLNLLQYHLERLAEDGYLELVLDGGRVRIFPPDLRKEDRRILGQVRDRRRLGVVMHLLDQTTSTHGAIAKALRMGKSTLSFHLKHLTDAGIVVQADHQYSLAEAQRVRALIDRYPPTPDMADRVADVWTSIYGRR